MDDDLHQVRFPDNVTEAGPNEIVRCFRLVEYCGPREWVVESVLHSVQGRKYIGPDRWIEAQTIIGTEYVTELDICVDQVRKALAKGQNSA